VIKDIQGLTVKVVPNTGNSTISYTNWLAANAIPNLPANPWRPDKDTDGDGISDGNEFLFGSNPKVANSVDFTVMKPGVVDDGNGGKFYEISYNRPAGSQRRNAYYSAYLTDHLPAKTNEWRPGIFEVVSITSTSPTTEHVVMRSNVQAKDSEEVFARIGGEILDLAPGLTPYYPIEGNPGDLTGERGKVGKVIYYHTVGVDQQSGGTVYGGPRYADISDMGKAAVHAGVVRATEYGVVKVTILPALSSYTGSTRNTITSQSLAGPFTNGEVSFTVEPAYP
jgi:hypothetical protein